MHALGWGETQRNDIPAGLCRHKNRDKYQKGLVKVLKSPQQENVTASEHGEGKGGVIWMLSTRKGVGGQCGGGETMKNILAGEKFLKKVDCFRSSE